MARYDSEQAREFAKWLEAEVGKEAQGIQSAANINQEEKEQMLKSLDGVKEQMSFEYGFDNSEL